MRIRFLVLFLSVLTTAAAAHASPTVLYRLDEAEAFQEGCFGQCLCPVMLADLEGTFGLTAAGTSGGFQTWTVSGVDWRVPQLGSHLTGSGVYRLGAGPDAQQQLVLDLSMDGGPVETYDSGVVPAVAAFPRIDVQVSLFDLQCYDRVLHVQASPSARPVAFRFEAVVTSVFDGLGALGGAVTPGDQLRGVYVFDPATPNTAEPVGEGEAGLYHHDRPPAGVRIRAGRFLFHSDRLHPDFDIIVNNDFGFAGADEYGFISRNNQARRLFPSAPVDRLIIQWLASTFTANPLESADLPLTPPDLDLLGGGLLEIEGECMRCLAPAAFFRIEATLTSLTRAVRMSVGRNLLRWEDVADAPGLDVVRGSLGALRASRDFAAATEGCIADDLAGTELVHDTNPDPGEAVWFLARPVRGAGAGTYDSYGLAQDDSRDSGIHASGRGCP